MKARPEIVGVIVAGGKKLARGKKRGSHGKGWPSAVWPMLPRPCSTSSSAFSFIAEDAEPYRFLRLPVYPGMIKDSRRLGGIHTSFVHSGAKSIFGRVCDTLFISQALIEYIIYYPRTDA